MSKFISGKELLKRWGIIAFEIVDYVIQGLQPHNNLGQPIPPPDIREKRSELERLKTLLPRKKKELANNEKDLKEVKEQGKDHPNVKKISKKRNMDRLLKKPKQHSSFVPSNEMLEYIMSRTEQREHKPQQREKPKTAIEEVIETTANDIRLNRRKLKL